MNYDFDFYWNEMLKDIKHQDLMDNYDSDFDLTKTVEEFSVEADLDLAMWIEELVA